MDKGNGLAATPVRPATPPSGVHLSSSLFAGSAAGCFSKTCVAPLSRLVVLRQVQSMPGELTSPVFQLCKDIYRKEGITAFWRGNCPTLLHRSCTSGLTFFVIAACNRFWKKPSEPRKGLDAFQWNLAISSTGALFSISLAHPLDVVKTRLLTERGNEQRYYRNTWNALRLIRRDEGVRGLYRGIGLSVTSAVPTIALNFTFFDTLRPLFESYYKKKANKLEVALCGGVSAACASSTLFPLDLLKKQMQLNGGRGRGGSEEVYLTWQDAVRRVYRQDGLRGFYRGLSLEIFKVVPGGAILFVANEYFLSWLNEGCVR